MEPDFRSQYESRARALTLRGIPVREMNREELLAVIGFLFERISSGGAPTAHSEQQTLALQEEQELEWEWEYPPSNDGLFEG